MTEQAMTTSKKSMLHTIAMILSFLLALPLASVLLIHPSLMLDQHGAYNHNVMMIIMLGISGGFIHGVGFAPRFWLWKWLFSPIVAWPLMLLGYYTWFLT